MKTAWLYACLLVFLPGRAQAQRGRDFNLQSPPLRTPTTGFPGLLDTNTALKNEFVFELPTFGVDYGINDHFTIGINGISGFSLLSVEPIFYLKARYRFLSNQRFSSAFTLYGVHILGQQTVDDGSSKVDLKREISFYGISSNSSLALSDSSVVFVSLLGFRVALELGKHGELLYARGSHSQVMAGLGYQYLGFSSWAPSLWLASPLVQDTQVESALDSASYQQNVAGAANSSIWLRLLADFRVSESWLLSAGVLVFPAEELVVVPLATAAYRF